MDNVIEINFRKEIDDLPHEYSSLWMRANKSTLFKTQGNEINFSHIRFKIYQTKHSFGVQFFYGVGECYDELPKFMYSSTPTYKQSIDQAWGEIFSELSKRDAEIPYKIGLFRTATTKRKQQ